MLLYMPRVQNVSIDHFLIYLYIFLLQLAHKIRSIDVVLCMYIDTDLVVNTTSSLSLSQCYTYVYV